MATHPMDRRTFLHTAGAVTAGGLVALSAHAAGRVDKDAGAPHAEKLGWRLGCQAWTFHDGTFYQATEKTASLGLHYIEAFPGQKVNGDSDAKMDENLSASARQEIKKHLADNGLKLVSFGVGGYSKPIFEFAKEMGIENIVSEPPFDAFDEIDKLCDEYQINLALHNHPKPGSRYWNPDTVLKVCKGHSKRIGACCDIGHWMRSEIQPLEALKKLEGHIIEFHFKDLNELGHDAHDVPWGTGKADVKALLAEVKRQGLKPVFSVEYEFHWGHSIPEIRESVAYFDKVAAELSQNAAPR
jgi:sugar phosphate isomerase/epimerase